MKVDQYIQQFFKQFDQLVTIYFIRKLMNIILKCIFTVKKRLLFLHIFLNYEKIMFFHTTKKKANNIFFRDVISYTIN